MTTPTPSVATRIVAAILCAVIAIPAIASDPSAFGDAVHTARTSQSEGEWVKSFKHRALDKQVVGLVSYDDGSGPALYTRSNNHVLKWHAGDWTPLPVAPVHIKGLVAIDADDGDAAGLYALSTTSGDHRYITMWDGIEWRPLGEGLGIVPNAAVAYDDGTGNGTHLYIGINMENPQPSIPHSVCRWDGFNLTPVPGTESIGLADAMIVHDDGQGDGTTIFIGGRTGVWKKSGDQWINIGQVAGAPNTTIRINAFAIHDDGSGPALYASGSFTSIDGIDAMKLAKWDGIEWLPVHSETEDFPTILVLSSFQAPGETQPHLYAGSSLFPDSLVPLFQRWDGSSWEDLTPQLAEQLNISSHIIEMVVFDDDNTGPRLYVAGRFQISNHAFCGGIARWDGASATPVGHGLNNIVHAITEFDSKPIVAGDFTRAGTVELNHIAQWDGQAWQPLGSGVSRDPVARIYATAVHDDGSGPALYAGGLFITAGGVPANNIARWDGNQWTPVGSGTNGLVYALQVYDDGSGSALYAGGSFTTAGGQTVNNIARWDGASWSPIGPGFDGTVFALCVYQGMLVAGGNFTYAGTERRNKIAIWDPSTGTWDRMRKGFDSSVRALAATQGSPTEPSLLYAAGYFAGSFEQLFSPAVAVWNGNVWSAPAANALRTADQHGNVTPPFATSIHVIEDPTGGAPTIYFGGRFLTPEPNPTQGVATLRNGQWINEGLDFSDMFNGIGAATTATRASAFHSFSENSLVGPAFAIAGNFIKVPGGDSFVSIWNLNTDITPAPCPGDINGDGIVDLDDFIILAGNFGSGPGATPQQGDLNGDGFVDLDDFIILAGNFGNNCN